MTRRGGAAGTGRGMREVALIGVNILAVKPKSSSRVPDTAEKRTTFEDLGHASGDGEEALTGGPRRPRRSAARARASSLGDTEDMQLYWLSAKVPSPSNGVPSSLSMFEKPRPRRRGAEGQTGLRSVSLDVFSKPMDLISRGRQGEDDGVGLCRLPELSRVKLELSASEGARSDDEAPLKNESKEGE